jgi:hypothetical protein
MNGQNLAIDKTGKSIRGEVNPRYLKKLEKIRRQKGVRFKNAEEFEAYFCD